MHRYSFLGHLSCLVFSRLSGFVVWCLTIIWGKFSVIIVSRISSVPFFLLLLIVPLCLCYTFSWCPWIFWVFFSLYSLRFLVFKGSIDTSSSSENPSLAMSSLLVSSSKKTFFISITVLFYLYHFFLVFS